MEKKLNDFIENIKTDIEPSKLRNKLIEETEYYYSFSLSDGSIYYANLETDKGYLCNPSTKQIRNVLITELYSRVFYDLNNNIFRIIDVSEYGVSVLKKELEDISQHLSDESIASIKYGIEQVKYAIKESGNEETK